MEVPAHDAARRLPRQGHAATGPPPPGARSRQHWDAVYHDRGPEGVSWFQPEPRISLELIGALDIDKSTPILDAGGGTSLLVDHLADDGFTDLTVLDVSETALETARRRLAGNRAVTWICADLLTWHPKRRYGLWHDRAVFHFLTDPTDRASYLATLRNALVPSAAVVMGTFAPEGPTHCSGLPVARYTAEDLTAQIGEDFCVTAARSQRHHTPSGAVQPFTWVTARLR